MVFGHGALDPAARLAQIAGSSRRSSSASLNRLLTSGLSRSTPRRWRPSATACLQHCSTSSWAFATDELRQSDAYRLSQHQPAGQLQVAA